MLAVPLANPAVAQSQHGVVSGVAAPARPEQITGSNAPDSNGCVKMCDLDTLPCDPWLYKKADGRCNLKD